MTRVSHIGIYTCYHTLKLRNVKKKLLNILLWIIILLILSSFPLLSPLMYCTGSVVSLETSFPHHLLISLCLPEILYQYQKWPKEPLTANIVCNLRSTGTPSKSVALSLSFSLSCCGGWHFLILSFEAFLVFRSSSLKYKYLTEK